MIATKIDRRSNGIREEGSVFWRFNVSQRVEHLLLLIAFFSLVATGLPQKFYSEAWAAGIVFLLGGIEITRVIHRFFAVVLVLVSVYHASYLVIGILRGKQPLSMVPTLRDVRDSFVMLRFSLGIASRHPLFDRFDYRQKFEYWGVVLGSVIMILTGAILWFPSYATYLLPGEFVPAAKEAHGGEALLAFLVIVIWHLYSVFLSPAQFPGESSIFTGRLSMEKMKKEHPLEYARLTGSPPVYPEDSLEAALTAEDLTVAGAASAREN